MRASLRLTSVLALLLAAGLGEVRAGVVTYDVTSLGGDQWRYDYSVTNDSLLGGLNWFTVYFPLGSYESLCGGSGGPVMCAVDPVAPAGWDLYVAQPEPAPLSDAGFFDVSTAGPGIAYGDTLGGFAINFRWLGSGTPGSQPFEFIEAGDEFLDVVDSGFTTPQPTTSVPEPGSLPLLALGLLGLLLYPRWLARSIARAGARTPAPASGRGRRHGPEA